MLCNRINENSLERKDPEDSGYRPWGEKNGDFENPESNPPLTTEAQSLKSVFRNSMFWIIGFSYL